MLELSVGDDDYGNVIGRGGRTAPRCARWSRRRRSGAGAACSSTSSTGEPSRGEPAGVAARRPRRAPARTRRQLPRHAAERRSCSTSARPSLVDDRELRASRAAPGPTGARSCASRDLTTARRPRRCAARSCWSRARTAPELGPDEWWAEDLEGCAVHDGDREVGTVRRLLALPSCEVLEVERVRRRRPARAAGHRRGARGRRRAARDRRRPRVPRRGVARSPVEIDVFTLFPEAFAWFERQRHVANALARRAPARVRQLPRPHAAERRPGRRHAVRRRRRAWSCGSTSSRRRCGRATAAIRSSCAASGA